MPQLILNLPDGSKIAKEARSKMIIGRSDDCTFSIKNDPKISRQHCRVDQRDNEFLLIDLGSANGTRLNDRKIGGERVLLKHGDIIRVGSHEIFFESPQQEITPFTERLGGFFERLLGRKKPPPNNKAVFGEGTLTCSCGAIISCSGKNPGQKVGCPRCKMMYIIPSK